MAGISRRRFLKNTVFTASLFATGNLAAFSREERPLSDAPAAASPSFDKLHLHGRIITPSDPDYDSAREDYNGRISSHPQVILYCESEHDVCEAIKWARENNIPVAPRSGGHSYEGFSVIDKGAVIDVSRMTKISVDTARRTATVEAGVRLLELYETLWSKRMVVPAGSCATVGIAGVTLGGGFGLLSRHLGLTCDNLIGIKLVDAKANVIEANAHKNADLFWACRGGGGGNFGVVTEFVFKLHPIEDVTVFRIKWNYDDMGPVIREWQNWAPRVDDRITSVLTMTSRKVNRVSCVGVFLGGQAEVRKLIKPLLDGVKPMSVSINTTPFMDAVHRFSGVPREKAGAARSVSASRAVGVAARSTAHGAALDPGKQVRSKSTPDMVHMHIHPRFKNTSDYVERELSDEAIKTIVKFLNDSPRDSSCLQFDSYGGKINQVPIKETAFCHRGETKFCMHYQINWNRACEDERNIKWVTDFKNAMKTHVSGFSYVNYCDLATENFGHSYYGENLPRLIEVKRKYDPEDFFHFAQGIPVKA